MKGRAATVTGRYLPRTSAKIALFTGGFEQRQGQKVGSDGGDGAGLVQTGDQAGEVADMAVRAGILEDRAEHVHRIEIGEGVADDDFPAERRGAGFDKGNGLRVAVGIHEEGGRLGLRDALAHGHGFGGGGRLIEKRRVGNVETGQVAHHRLVVQQGFKTALRNFRLVGRIGRVPGGVFQNVALDDRRRDGAVIALADQRGQDEVLVGRFAQAVEGFALGQSRTPGERRLLADGRRHGRVDQGVEVLVADNLEHLGHFRRRRPDMTPVGEIIGLIVGKMEFGGRRHYAISSL